jgi:hypothetical protein
VQKPTQDQQFQRKSSVSPAIGHPIGGLLPQEHQERPFREAEVGGLLFTMLILSTNDASASVPEQPLLCQIHVSASGPSILPAVRLSRTFQQQCQRLAGAHVVVVVQWADDMTSLHHAETRILRNDGRVFRAVVRLRAADEPAVQLIHELEHVIEALDGIDHRLASCGWRTRAGAYETTRARLVEAEVRRELGSGPSASMRARPRSGPFEETTSAGGIHNTGSAAEVRRLVRLTPRGPVSMDPPQELSHCR